MNNEELMHRSHKYIYKYRGKNGEYVYVYDDKVTKSKDPKEFINGVGITNGVANYYKDRITKEKTEVYGPFSGKKNVSQGDIVSYTIEQGRNEFAHCGTYKVSILLKDGNKAIIEEGKEWVDNAAKEHGKITGITKKSSPSNSLRKRSTSNKRRVYVHNKMKSKKTAIKVRRNASKSFYKEGAYNVSKTNW